MDIGPVISLYGTAPQDHPFSLENLVNWCGRMIEAENVYVVLGMCKEKIVGYFIAFAPWELDDYLNVFWVFIAPEFRRSAFIFKDTFRLIKALARFQGARGIAFETPQPRAWQRIIGSRGEARTRIKVEV